MTSALIANYPRFLAAANIQRCGRFAGGIGAGKRQVGKLVPARRWALSLDLVLVRGRTPANDNGYHGNEGCNYSPHASPP